MENVRQAGLLVKSLAGVLQSTVQYELLRTRTAESQVREATTRALGMKLIRVEFVQI
jgi:hypothetical protein